MTASALRSDFWESFRTLNASKGWGLGSFRHVHGNDAYVQFDDPLGSGFHPRAIFLTSANELRAELLTQSRRGLEYVDTLLAASPIWQTANGSTAEASVTSDRSSAKIQLVWTNAMTQNRQLWEVHQTWLSLCLSELRLTFGPPIAQWSQT